MKSDITDLSFFQIWLNEKKNLQPSSIKTYIDSVSRFLATNPDIEKLDDYNNFIIKYAIKKRCNHYFSALKAFIEFKITDSKTKIILLEGLERPPERHDIIRERKHLNDKKIMEIISFLQSEKHQIVAYIMKLTAVRVSEVLKLKRGDIITEEYQEKTVIRLNIHGKGQKHNIVYIHFKEDQDLIMNYVTNNLGVNDFYFITLGHMEKRCGNLNDNQSLIRMNYHWFWEDLKQACQMFGIDRKDFAAHDFRRCFARRLWEKTHDLYKLQCALNHRDPKTTLRYLSQSGLKNIDTFYEMQKPS